MKTGEAGINSHITGTVTTLSHQVKLVLTNGTNIGLTDHDATFTYDSLQYKVNNAINRSAIEALTDLNAANFEFTSLFDSGDITDEDLRAGLYEGAEFYSFTINWANLANGIIKFQRGWLGEMEMRNGTWIAKFEGFSYRLKKNLLTIVQAPCHYTFGDSKCTFDLNTVKELGTVTGVTDQRTFTASGITTTNGFFQDGEFRWTSGLNNGITHEVKNNTGSSVTLHLKAPFTIAISDTFDIFEPCDRSLDGAKGCQFHNNVINFGGKPHVDGRKKLLDYPMRV